MCPLSMHYPNIYLAKQRKLHEPLLSIRYEPRTLQMPEQHLDHIYIGERQGFVSTRDTHKH